MNNEPAFPQTWHPDMGCDPRQTPPGMTLRDYFASQAMTLAGFKIASDADFQPLYDKQAANRAYAFADAMLKAREDSTDR